MSHIFCSVSGPILGNPIYGIVPVIGRTKVGYPSFVHLTMLTYLVGRHGFCRNIKKQLKKQTKKQKQKKNNKQTKN